MRNTLLTLLTFVVILTVFSGCAAKQQNDARNFEAGERMGQFQRADLSGEVTLVEGNKLTLKVIETPQFNGNMSQGERQGMRQRRQGGDGEVDNGQRRGPAVAADNGGQLRRSVGEREMNYTGETISITVPDDVQITTATIGQNGMEVKNIKLDEIKEGDIVQIWYADDGSETISRINVGSFGRRQ